MIAELARPLLVAPLGIRFWDAALDRQVRAGLRVRAWESHGRGPRVLAYRTLSDVYAFRGLPGLVDYEQPAAHATATASPPAVRGYVVEVTDPAERYESIAFGVDLPLPAPPLLPDALVAPASPPAPPGGWLLYSTPSRLPAPGFAVVRGQLLSERTGEPIAHALVEVELTPGERWHGLSSRNGSFAVHLPYPAPPSLLATSPPTLPPGGLADVEWPAVLRVWWSPQTWTELAGTDLPSYPSLLAQPPADVYPVHPDDGGAAQSEWTGVLRFGRELVARTEGFSPLLVDDPVTSP